jgi:integrase
LEEEQEGNQNQIKQQLQKINHKELLNDPTIRRWYSNNKKGSRMRADIYLRSISRFCFSYMKMRPDEFAKLTVEEMENLAVDFVDCIEGALNPKTGRKYSPGYVESYVKAIRSWADWNKKTFVRKIKISNLTKTPTLENERVPTADELRRVLYADTTPLRSRASIAIMAFCGARPEVQGNHEGEDGIRIKDFPELQILSDEESDKKQKEVMFLKIPTIMLVKDELSKSRRKYMTFLCEEGCEIVKQYLDSRIRQGEVLTPESGVIVTTAKQASKIKIAAETIQREDASPFLVTITVSDGIREAMRLAGLPWRPYVFRSYFDTALNIAEGKLGLPHSYQQFWMGHVGDIETTYTTSKGRLPEDLVETMREWYRKAAANFLQTRASREDIVTVEDAKAIGKETWFVSLGFTKDEIQKLDLMHKEGTELQDALRQKLQSILAENGRRQKLIRAEEIDSAIADGYEYVDKLPDGRLIMKLPEFYQ